MMCFAFVTLSFSSWYQKKDTIAVVTVVDSSESPVNGAEVTLRWVDIAAAGNGSEEREGVLQTGTTDGSGKVSFNYNELYKSGQAGVFVLDIEVNGDVLGIIKVEQEVTTEETVILD